MPSDRPHLEGCLKAPSRADWSPREGAKPSTEAINAPCGRAPSPRVKRQTNAASQTAPGISRTR